ncbi:MULTISPECIES: NAD(P)-dependent alcohol dehydrogenase [Leuconostoc]|uniref:NAD(P)-dependent alcohol dehydrogenase n=1 Tax=Leuconostoc TaxID=1243 RepID=UPI001B8C9A10|nr:MULTISPECIES: NAD(P)-dependent alcohol dehydrogenase [Leuconostoc]MBS0941864.1 NAD(P)-dependent alcohol dehydrogenase [Leuconostoc mesenteroides]MBS1008171.1 NAD(P)-dependent alcohol dehydrogenase [Leuconostoc suionicum]
MSKVTALQAPSSNYEDFERTTIERRDLRSDDVAIDIKYCGICHSDIHQVDGDFHNSVFPMVPGHEITGIVSAVGDKVSDFKVGDHVGVGCFVDSCGECEYCLKGQEQFCTKGVVIVFNSKDYDGNNTLGGYSQSIVVKNKFVVKVPTSMDLASASPLLCAGITTYAPMKKWGVKSGMNIAIIGLGGLGHIAVQFAHALGANVTVLGHSLNKKDEAKQFGADSYYINNDDKTFEKLAGQFDFILNTTAVDLNVDLYLRLLKKDGVMVYVGLPSDAQSFHVFSLIAGEKIITASNVGGLALTQEMMDFSAEHNILPQIEMIDADYVPEAYKRILDSDVRYRFVIDMATL